MHAFDLIDMDDIVSKEVRHFGTWFLRALLACSCAEGKLAGMGTVY
jgi:hypothetical protein